MIHHLTADNKNFDAKWLKNPNIEERHESPLRQKFTHHTLTLSSSLLSSSSYFILQHNIKQIRIITV